MKTFAVYMTKFIAIFSVLVALIVQTSIAEEKRMVLNSEAENYFSIAAQLEAKGDRRSIRKIWNKAAKPLMDIAEHYYNSEQYDEAIVIYKRLYELNKRVYGENHRKTKRFLGKLEYVYSLAGRHVDQIMIAEKKLADLEKRLGVNHRQTLKQMGKLAFTYKQEKYYLKSEKLYKRIIAGYRKNGWTQSHKYKQALYRIASLYLDQGDMIKAEPYYIESLGFKSGQKINVKSVSMTKLYQYAYILQYSGKYAEAEDLYKRMLSSNKSVSIMNRTSDEQIIANLGNLYNQIGAYDKALEYKQRAYETYKAKLGGNSVITAIALNNLAETYLALKQFDKAVSTMEIVYIIFNSQVKEKNRLYIDKNFIMPNLALAYSKVGRFKEAEEVYKQTLTALSNDYSARHPLVTYSKIYLSEVYYLQNRLDEAARVNLESLNAAVGNKSPLLLSKAYIMLAKIRNKQSLLSEAIFYGKQGINQIQSLRSGLVNSDKILQESFVDSQQDNYEMLAGWLIDAGRLAEAEQVLAMLKEEEYFNFIRRTQGDNPKNTLAQLNKLELEQKSILRKSSALLVKYTTRLAALEKMDPRLQTDNDKRNIIKTRKLVNVAENNFNQTLNRIKSVFRSKKNETFLNPGDSKGYQQLLKNLGGDVALVHILPLENDLRIIFRTSKNNVSKKISVTQRQFNKLVGSYKEQVKRPDKSPEKLITMSNQLYQWLIKPIENDLKKANIKTVMFYKNGVLRYIPLATLHDGKQYLIEKYAISNYTAAANDSFKAKEQSGWTIAGMGVSKQHGAFSPLPMVPYELDNIVKQASNDPNGIFNGKIFVNEQFTPKRFKSSLTGAYNVSHIATHYKFMPGTESDSFLLMGDGSHLSLATLRTDNYDFKSIDLLTLSACETAVSDIGSDGREIEGLATLVQRQGAKGVMATLWSVADCSTGLFMQHFYQYRKKGLSKAEALRQSQLAFLSNQVASLKVSANDPAKGCQPVTGNHKDAYRHPYYWAPFILMGNWK